MIIWLASYPKSGNTLLRSMLSAYLYSKDGNFDFDQLKNIKQFPDNNVFKKLGVDISNENEVVKNYISAQKEINKRDGNSIRLLKTHSALHDINGHKFTDLENTLGAIYVVRDPRNVVNSYQNHSQISTEEAKNRLTEKRIIGGENDVANKTTMHIGSWSSNYNSWKELKKVNRYLLVKYEDLVSDKKKTFINILNFIYKLMNLKLIIDDKKINNILKTTSFEYLQDLEREFGFSESVNANNKKRVTFFKFGNKNDGKNSLPLDTKKELENSLQEEMKELGYL
ncbi:sulfotransferase domain-containing protein [Candidatus Pelagibacter bacterium nBUS_30]|uniref:sulfotransferase domain-containing protein n=1 Tax=Candidatus Pelagibacter bacterium nBUS_30 TaxID=3374191 RepID=UPI003EB6E79D